MDSNASQVLGGVGSVNPTPKFKKRAVSAVRDWPPGCGPASEQISRQIAVVPINESVDVESIVLRVIKCVTLTHFIGLICYYLCIAKAEVMVEITKLPLWVKARMPSKPVMVPNVNCIYWNLHVPFTR